MNRPYRPENSAPRVDAAIKSNPNKGFDQRGVRRTPISGRAPLAPTTQYAQTRSERERWTFYEPLFFSISIFRSSRRMIFPVVVMGSSLTKSISRGYSWAASLVFTKF